MLFKSVKTDLREILPLRNLYLQETNFQIRYNACHERRWTDSYLLTQNGEAIGYGSVKGAEKQSDRDTVFEFYLLPRLRAKATSAFSELLHASGAGCIECQSNDHLLSSMLYQFCQDINANTILFKDNMPSSSNRTNVFFRKRCDSDSIFAHKVEPVGEYVLEYNKEIVASGGFALHYNIPFADLYMEVKETERNKGLGSFLVGKLKEECYRNGRVPAARCAIDNTASKATLLRAGLTIAGFMLLGNVR